MPELVGGEGDDSGDEAPDVSGALGFKEGLVTAVVKDDKESDAEAAGEDNERDGEPW